jgi:hypothetical protein
MFYEVRKGAEMELQVKKELLSDYTAIIRNKQTNKELKLFAILELLHEEIISLHKAHELCTECGLFSDHWMFVQSEFNYRKKRLSNE